MKSRAATMYAAPAFWLAFSGFLLATVMYWWKPELASRARKLFAWPVRVLENNLGALTAAALLLTGCVEGEDSAPATPATAAGGDAPAELRLDYAYYNPASLVLREQQWLEKDLAAKGVHVISAGADEVPYVYKNILDVMAQQFDLVDVVGRFDPKIVKMCGDGSKAED